MSDTNVELNDDTVKTAAMGADVRLFGAESSAAARPSSYGRASVYATVQAALLADPATARASLDLEVGTDVQAYDADLTTLGAGGSGARDFLGLGTANSPQFTAVNLGHASANTLTASSGVLSIEGRNLSFRHMVSVTDPEYGADATGVTDATSAFTAASATGKLVYVPPGIFKISSPTTYTSAWLIDPLASFVGPGGSAKTFFPARGHWTDKDNGAGIWKFERLFVGAAHDNDGQAAGTVSRTYIADASLGHFHERNAQLMSLSSVGGGGGLFASRKSDRYTHVSGSGAVWTSGATGNLNDIVWWLGRVYQVTTAGTFSSTAPSHTSGAVANGTATLTFVDYAYTTSIGASAIVVNDLAPDGNGAWATYVQAFRMSGGGTTYAGEIGAPNFGTDVVGDPYAISPNGATIGWWMPAGYDPAILSSTNPSTAAIVIGTVDNTWNSGIIFEDGGLTAIGGFGEAIQVPQATSFVQYVAAGSFGSRIDFNVTANNERTRLAFGNRTITMGAVGATMGTFESAAAAGTAPANYLRLIANAAATTYAELRSGGSDTDVDVRVNTKGSGEIDFQIGNTTYATVGNTGIRLVGASVGLTQDTTDGSDTRFTLVGGGGANVANQRSRGAFIQAYGNEHASEPGELWLHAGNVSTGDIVALTGAGVERLRVTASTGAVTASTPTGGLGYGTGAGGTVTQATSKATGVTLNTVCGTITLNAASLAAATTVGFTLTNSAIAATDVPFVCIKSGATADSYSVTVGAVAAGSCRIELRNNTGGALAEAVVLSFAVMKAVAA